VLFADLVGFTALSESRDPEEVRELLTRYFDIARSFIERYGGTVEKFIGDAVMAVWGTPVANEDDAERAVRAALDLVEAVAALGQEVRAPALTARAAVLTGEAAVNLAAQGQGMVAGDLVNTASRVQSAADPGSVLVGESTRRASEAAIAYEDAGLRELKGKAEPVPLYRALRVVAGRGGLMKSEGLEPPFVGRDRELKLVKDLFHACVEDGKAHLVQVTGIAGIGKSRLTWEFFKYMDGLQRLFFWHRGRCLSYGEGVTYWALAEMVRGRADILEGEDRSSALTKLHEAVGRYLPDPEDSRFVEPRLAHLLSLEDRQVPDKADLFAGWRLFFERLAERDPVLMVFEDMQWADPSLVEFLDYLLDWSRNHPLFVMTLARPEARGQTLAGSKRNATSIYLEPLPRPAMQQLLRGFVPGLPADLADKILNRAEGVPLYAVETVRMLLDRALLVQEGAVYRPTGTIEALEIPETLHALIAARLDGLAPEERRLLQDASVVGKTFTTEALAGLTGTQAEQVEPILTALVRKEVLSLVADPRSPERGQFGFLQDLVRTVAYETLPKRERKTKHLAVAAYFEGAGYQEEEIAEVLASHYLDAYNEVPAAADAPAIKEKARLMLVRAGERAASLAANEAALRHFEHALDLADEALDRAELSERAGRVGWVAGEREAAKRRLEDAVVAYESLGEQTRAASVRAVLGEIAFDEGRLESGIREMEAAYGALSAQPGNNALAALGAQLARLHFFAGNVELAIGYTEQALALAEARRLPDVLSQALNTKGVILAARNRFYEGEMLLRAALQLALDHDAPPAALRAYNNLASVLAFLDRNEEALQLLEPFLALARRVGDRLWEWGALGGAIDPLIQLGRWDEALARAEETKAAMGGAASTTAIELLFVPFVHVQRGDLDRARSELDATFQVIGDSDDAQIRATCDSALAIVLQAEGHHRAARDAGERGFSARAELGLTHPAAKQGFVAATEASLDLDDVASAAHYLSVIEEAGPGEISPFFHAQHARFKARLARIEGTPEAAEAGFKEAAGTFREMGMPFWLAVALLEHAEVAISSSGTAKAEPLLSEAQEIFTRLQARPWIDRLESARPATIRTS
jgi:class 3 adenylate cyclase/tetratricopeptide (TPR) repeat protein